MKKAIICLVMCLTVTAVQADERLFQKISRKIERDSVKGLLYAKKLKSKRSVEPDAYYFLATAYLNKSHAESNFSRQYIALNRASSEAYRMKKYSNSETYLSTLKDTLIAQLARQLAFQRDSFIKLEDFDRSERLAQHYHRLTNRSLPSLEQLDSIKEEAAKQEKLLLQVARVMDGKYYGMPTGDEDIPSHSFSKEKEILALINKERVRKGMEALKWDFSLCRAARYHANDMATQGYFDHNTYDRIDGELVEIGGTFARIRKFYDLRFVNSENIAAGSSTAADTYYQWYTSKGHYANMFRKESKYVGLGVAYNPDSPYKYYWVFCTSR